MVDLYMCVCARVHININKMSGRDHENWTTKFDCICYQNFSLKTKFFLDFLFILTTLVGFTQLTIHMLYMF